VREFRRADTLEIVKQHRINILGASGSGTSTTGRALSTALAVPYLDSDEYYHEPSDPPFQKQRLPEARHALIMADLGRATSWVLAGGVAGWEPGPQLDFTLMVFLWVPAPIRIERLRRRESQRFGQRILEGGDMHHAHEAFIEWAARYDSGGIEGKTLARHEAYLASQACPILRFREVMSIAQITDAIVAALE
jgi:adenylate kinase family enzyme